MDFKGVNRVNGAANHFEDNDENFSDETSNSTGRLSCISCRNVLAFLGFLGFINVYCLRVNLSVALVAMVNSSHDTSSSNFTPECPSNGTTNAEPSKGEVFNWDSNTQGLILGSFFYGYIFTQIPGGWMAERIGGKKIFGFGILCTSVLTLLTPLAARQSVSLLVALRVLEGIGEGVTFPAMHALLAKWAPPLERSKLVTFIYSGAQLGTVIAMPVSGLLCQYGFAGGWPSVFYVFGAIGCLWFLFWMLLVSDSPASHPRISQSEKSHIEKAIGMKDYKMSTPWRSILTSVPVYAVIVAHFANNWGFYTLLTCLPTYMKEILGLDLSENGFLSGMAYLITWFCMAGGGQIADFLRYRNILSTTVVRKLFACTGLLLPAALLVATGFVGCDTTLALVLVTLAVGTSGLAMSGYGVNHLDIAPPHAGTLMGISNMVATIPGFVGPQVVGALTSQGHTRQQWRIVFYISGAVYVFGSVVYSLFGSGVQQPWAKPEYFAIKEVPDDDNDDTEDGIKSS